MDTKFAVYSKKTSYLYIHYYPWYPMTTSMNKILIHDPANRQHTLLPIAQLPEEPAEASNKHYSLFLEKTRRKILKGCM